LRREKRKFGPDFVPDVCIGLVSLRDWLDRPPSRKHAHVGRQWTERPLLAELKNILRKLKLPGKVHTSRLFFVSNAVMQGMPEATVRKWVRQVDEEVLKMYTHVHDRASQAPCSACMMPI
jgi:hypothetical protein